MTKVHYHFITYYQDGYNDGLKKILFLLLLSHFTNTHFIIDLLLIFIIYMR